nr:MAG TPA: hypothetical protein [Herelleviridae sp.]
MESPQTVPKDTLDKQNTPYNLLLSLFQALSFQNNIYTTHIKITS